MDVDKRTVLSSTQRLSHFVSRDHCWSRPAQQDIMWREIEWGREMGRLTEWWNLWPVSCIFVYSQYCRCAFIFVFLWNPSKSGIHKCSLCFHRVNSEDIYSLCSQLQDEQKFWGKKVQKNSLLYWHVLGLEKWVVFSARCNIYISRLCYDVSVRLSVTEVHWHIIANLGFKFRSKFTTHCGRGEG